MNRRPMQKCNALRCVTKKKPNYIRHTFGTMSIGKPLGQRKNNFLALLCCNFIAVSYSVLEFQAFMQHSISSLCHNFKNFLTHLFVLYVVEYKQMCQKVFYVVLHVVGCCETVRGLKIEQRFNLKFLVKLNMTPTKCFKLLKEIYGEDVMLRTQIFECHKRFVKGREEVEDDPTTGRPSTTRTDENITRVNKLVRSDRRLIVRMISEDLGMQKVYPKMVPEISPKDQKQNRVKFCENML